jgi:GAF domain-containing protein
MTVSADGLRQALDQLADLRTSPVTVEEALDRVVASADALFGVDGTALMLVDRDQVLRNLAASDRRAALLEELQAEHGEVGVVAVFAGQPHPWTGAEREAIVAFTELVALLILNAMEASERGRLAAELQVALDSRVVIEQAKGVLVGRHGLTTRQAFERLRRQARDQRRPLSEVARGVVSAAEHR